MVSCATNPFRMFTVACSKFPCCTMPISDILTIVQILIILAYYVAFVNWLLDPVALNT